MHTFGFDHSVSAMVLSAYGILLLFLMLWLDMASVRQDENFDFAKLLAKVEPLRLGDSLRPPRKPGLLGTNRQRKILEDLESLRRISANASILPRLAGLNGSEGIVEERKLVKQLQKDSVKLKLCVHVVRLALPKLGYAPLVIGVLSYVDQSYWSMVSRLYVFYGLHHARRKAALTAAFNLSV